MRTGGDSTKIGNFLKKIAEDKSIIPLGIIEKIPKNKKNLLNNLKPTMSLFLFLI